MTALPNLAEPISSIADDIAFPEATERVLTEDALALFDAVHKLCGTGVVRDREWWAVESARLGSDWRGINALRANIIAECTAAALKRATGWAPGRAA